MNREKVSIAPLFLLMLILLFAESSKAFWNKLNEKRSAASESSVEHHGPSVVRNSDIRGLEKGQTAAGTIRERIKFLQEKIERTQQVYFSKSGGVCSVYQHLRKRVVSGTLGFFPEKYRPVLPVRTGIFGGARSLRMLGVPWTENGTGYVLCVPLSTRILCDRIRIHGECAAKLVNRHPGLHFGFFQTALPAQQFCDGNLFDSRKVLTAFQNGLNGSSKSGYIYAGPSFSNGFFRTDSHWTARGGYAAYEQLCRDFNLGIPVPVSSWHTVKGLVFKGGFSDQAVSFPAIAEGEPFEVGDFKICVTGTEINGVVGQRGKQNEYLLDSYTCGSENRYLDCFGGVVGLVHYRSSAGTGKRLLVIRDSMSFNIERLLASHFDDSWFVDLRVYKEDMRIAFGFDDFVREKGITDVLFLGQGVFCPDHKIY